MNRGKKRISTAGIVKPTIVGVENIYPEKSDVSQGLKMKKMSAEKLPGPRQVTDFVGKRIVADYKIDSDSSNFLKMVVHRRPHEAAVYDYRIYDESEAQAMNVKVKDYTSLDEHQVLIFYEGSYNEDTKHVEITEKKKVRFRVPLFTEAEIQQQIEGLSQPGGTVFFYQARGPARGGPLGMGAAVVELNPDQSKKGKKYNVYTVDVVNMQPLDNKQKLYNMDKSKEIAAWIKESHCKRMY